MVALDAPSERPNPAVEPVRIQPVSGDHALDEFIRLPNRLYRGEAGHVPPLLMERRATLRFDKNPYFRHAQGQYWLAYRGAQAVGRISAQIDDLYLAQYRNATGHFGLLDAEDDPEIFQALTATAEDWLRARGMRRSLGPLSLSTNEECGLLIDGFDARPMMMMSFDPPYVGERLAALGYVKAKDLIAYDYDLINAPPISSKRFLERAKSNSRVAIRMVDMSRYRADLSEILDIFNDAWSENRGFVPLTEAEVAQTADNIRPLIRPDFVWIAEVDHSPAAMIVCLPNLYEAIADLDGRLLPFGWAKLLWRLKMSRLQTCRVVLLGVRKQYHRSPLGSALTLLVVETLRESLRKAGMRHAELSWILEDNMPMRRIIEGIGADPYKTYRIFEKALT